MAEIVWTPYALDLLLEAVTYIAEDNPLAAYGVEQQIVKQTGSLSEHPQMGRVGRIGGTRELVITKTPYIVAYRVKGDAVDILAVFHSSRAWPDKL